ncbi:MAG: S46 family peptidase [bacterium]|nr:MAG: S46 family peptidase [bacterium]
MAGRCIAALVILSVLVMAAASLAEEGMWPLDKLDKTMYKRMKAMGLELSSKDIYDGKGGGIAYAIVQLGGGTASFVSPKGLMFTNHHVAFTALQRVSTAEQNYIEEGFLAEGYEDEIPAPGYRAYVLLSIKDVTKKVFGAVKDEMSDLERYNAIEMRSKEIVEECEENRDVECRVASFYDGMEYKLFTYFVVKDIRIVYAPMRSIGNYGGDIDNWMWPRHTGDFSFLRAYVAPDGSSAEYADENIPYVPSVFLHISSKGVKKNDFTMVIGYPGQTMRYRSSNSIGHHQNFNYPRRIKMFRELLNIFNRAAEADESVAIKVASFDAMLNNAMKNYEGMLEGFEKAGLLDRKLAEEKEFTAWLESNGEMKKKYDDVLPSIKAQYDDYKMRREKNMITGFTGFGCLMIRASSMIYRWCLEKEKEDIEREPGYQERDVPRLKQGLKILQLSYDRETDKKVLSYFMHRALELPENQRIEAFDDMMSEAPGSSDSDKIDAIIEELYSGTKLESAEERLRMFDLSRKELLEEGDPFIEFAMKLREEIKVLEEKDKGFGGALNKLRPKLIEAYAKWKGGALYPDANGTMRLTYGVVKGYSPKDAVNYSYITNLSGVVEKHTGEEPFDCPEEILELYEARDFGGYVDAVTGDVPVDFLSTCDITGGNSGSPILNARGEVIGSAFDGNYESISADYLFNERLTRDINVDVRYALFVMDKVSGAQHLLDELTIH